MKHYKRLGDLRRWRYGGTLPPVVYASVFIKRRRIGGAQWFPDGSRIETTGRGWDWFPPSNVRPSA